MQQLQTPAPRNKITQPPLLRTVSAGEASTLVVYVIIGACTHEKILLTTKGCLLQFEGSVVRGCLCLSIDLFRNQVKDLRIEDPTIGQVDEMSE